MDLYLLIITLRGVSSWCGRKISLLCNISVVTSSPDTNDLENLVIKISALLLFVGPLRVRVDEVFIQLQYKDQFLWGRGSNVFFSLRLKKLREKTFKTNFAKGANNSEQFFQKNQTISSVHKHNHGKLTPGPCLSQLNKKLPQCFKYYFTLSRDKYSQG